MLKISVIIPTLNEEDYIEKLLMQLEKEKNIHEIIVVDAGSSDRTLKLVNKYKVKLIKGERSRGRQLNKGANVATGNIFLFIHADTLLPENSIALIIKSFENPEVKIASFKLGFDRNNFILNLYTWFTKFDSIFTTFGDQAIIITKNFYNYLGGFPKQPIFEDVDFLKKARKFCKIYKLPAPVTTSSRRFNKYGLIKTQFINMYLFILYFLKVDINKIYSIYYKYSKVKNG